LPVGPVQVLHEHTKFGAELAAFVQKLKERVRIHAVLVTGAVANSAGREASLPEQSERSVNGPNEDARGLGLKAKYPITVAALANEPFVQWQHDHTPPNSLARVEERRKTVRGEVELRRRVHRDGGLVLAIDLHRFAGNKLFE